MLRAPYGDGGRLVLLSKDGSTRVLTADFESAADPAVSFDGKRILFAAKKSAGDRWNIFEMAADGSGRSPGHARRRELPEADVPVGAVLPQRRPALLSGHLRQRCGRRTQRVWPPAATDLYSVRFDGSGLRRLTYGVSASYDPFQMQDGRILFSNWQRSHPGNGVLGRIDLFAVHLDGTDYAAFSGTQGLRIKHMACTTSKGMVVFVESERPPWDGAGQHRRHQPPPESALLQGGHGAGGRPVSLAVASAGRLDPGFAAAGRRRRHMRSTASIWQSGSRTLVFAQPGYHSIQAVALAERPEPDGHSSVVEDDQNWSKLYCLNVYENDLKREWMPPGTARRIRVIEGLPRTAGASGTTWPTCRRLSGMIQKRLLGDLELDDDGSFHLLVPPNTPIQLQIVDRDGMALRTSAWIWAKNKENRGCIGCHEDGERTPENVFAKALGHDAAELMLPPERRRTVDFRRDVQPILTAKCANRACHGGAVPPAW